MRRFLKDNSLSLAMFALFVVALVGQSATGLRVYNRGQLDHDQPAVGYAEYLTTDAFIEVTFENWESEFLQMAAYVMLTVFLFQRGSAESKDPDKKHHVDEDPRDHRDDPNAPWPVRRGGIILRLYENSLFSAFALLFLLSFVLHALGGAGEYSEEQIAHGAPGVSLFQYFGTSQFWFESLQNWQSEFLAVGAIVVLSVFLRQRGSPESKPVAASNNETGN
jgi:hypothetical protein